MVRMTATRFLLLVLVIGLLLFVNYYVNHWIFGANVREHVDEQLRPQRQHLKPRMKPQPKPKLSGTIMQEQDIYSDSFDDHRMDRIVALRNQTLTKACLTRSIATKDTLFRFDLAKDAGKFNSAVRPRLLVSDQHKAIYCAIGRCGSENWETIIERMEKGHGKPAKDFDPRYAGSPTLRELWDFREPAIHHRISEYYKFVIVREPLTRFLSAYKKFVAGDGEDNVIAGEFRSWIENGTRKSLPKLEAFVDFVLAKNEVPGDLEWGLYNDLCAPCFVKYDFIGRYETIQDDAHHIMKHANVKNIQYNDPHKEHFKQNFLDELQRALPSGKFLKLFEKYKLDYELFGYPQP